MYDKLHPDASLALIGGGFMLRDEDMERDIGRTVRYKPPVDVASHGTVARDYTFRIVGVQKVFNGTKAYRGLCNDGHDTFGRPLRPEDIEFLTPRIEPEGDQDTGPTPG
jgi:hypothetical protein